MTQDNPMNDAYQQILRAYNPLEIKDILLHGASRKATKQLVRHGKEVYERGRRTICT